MSILDASAWLCCLLCSFHWVICRAMDTCSYFGSVSPNMGWWEHKIRKSHVTQSSSRCIYYSNARPLLKILMCPSSHPLKRRKPKQNPQTGTFTLLSPGPAPASRIPRSCWLTGTEGKSISLTCSDCAQHLKARLGFFCLTHHHPGPE